MGWPLGALAYGRARSRSWQAKAGGRCWSIQIVVPGEVGKISNTISPARQDIAPETLRFSSITIQLPSAVDSTDDKGILINIGAEHIDRAIVVRATGFPKIPRHFRYEYALSEVLAYELAVGIDR